MPSLCGRLPAWTPKYVKQLPFGFFLKPLLPLLVRLKQELSKPGVIRGDLLRCHGDVIRAQQVTHCPRQGFRVAEGLRAGTTQKTVRNCLCAHGMISMQFGDDFPAGHVCRQAQVFAHDLHSSAIADALLPVMGGMLGGDELSLVLRYAEAVQIDRLQIQQQREKSFALWHKSLTPITQNMAAGFHPTKGGPKHNMTIRKPLV